MSATEITVLMPMGGLGQRFVDAGYATPKPMIDVEGAPMFIRALESFPSDWKIRHVFVIRQDQESAFGLTDLIRRACPDARIAVLDHDTCGAVETCLIAKDLISPDQPIVIADCDTRFHSTAYREEVESDAFDGVLVGFESTDARYSYAELDEAGVVVRTAEKVPISSHALLGGYYFRSGGLFLSLAERFVSAGLGGSLKEFYVSHLYNLLLQEGGRVGFAAADWFDIWGTPEELAVYLGSKR